MATAGSAITTRVLLASVCTLAVGCMSEALTERSTAGLTDDDLQAIVVALPSLSPEERVSYLPVFYDALKDEQEDFWFRQRIAEATNTIWSDVEISDELLGDTHRSHFSVDANMTDTLHWYFVEFLWGWHSGGWERRPDRFDRIVARSMLDDVVVRLLTARSNLNLQRRSPLVSNADQNHAFTAALRVLNWITDLDHPTRFGANTTSLDNADRQYLFDATLDVIGRVPYLNKRGDGRRRGLHYQDRVSDNVALLLTRSFDLNPVTNYQGLSDQERSGLKDRIADAYSLGGMHANLWNDFTILIHPSYDRQIYFYYNLFAAYPSVPIMLGKSSVIYRNDQWGGPADVAFPIGSSGMIEITPHGVAHNIAGYLERNSDAGKTRIGTERIAALADATSDRECDKQLIHVTYHGNTGGQCDPWSWPEMLAELGMFYMVDSRRVLRAALEAPHTEPLDQLLFFVDLYSLETNTSRFYHWPGIPIDVWDSTSRRPIEVTDVSITRNEAGFVDSLTVDRITYRFTLDAEGDVVNVSR